jgi:hypothetical protein
MTTTCHKCQNGYERGVNGNEWTGTEWVRVNLCLDCYHAVGFTQKPRQPRRPRQARALYGDYAQLAMLNGIRTDGTGRKAR